jgi:hypothetical protein
MRSLGFNNDQDLLSALVVLLFQPPLSLAQAEEKRAKSVEFKRGANSMTLVEKVRMTNRWNTCWQQKRTKADYQANVESEQSNRLDLKAPEDTDPLSTCEL